MKNKIISFEELNCWKACRDVRIDVMKLIKAKSNNKKDSNMLHEDIVTYDA